MVPETDTVLKKPINNYKILYFCVVSFWTLYVVFVMIVPSHITIYGCNFFFLEFICRIEINCLLIFFFLIPASIVLFLLIFLILYLFIISLIWYLLQLFYVPSKKLFYFDCLWIDLLVSYFFWVYLFESLISSSIMLTKVSVYFLVTLKILVNMWFLTYWTYLPM